MTPKTAHATAIFNTTPITLTFTVGGPAVTWQSGDGGSLPLPGGAKLGFSLYQCHCSNALVGVIPDPYLAFGVALLSTLNSSSFPFLKLLSFGASSTGPRISGFPAGVGSFKSSSGNLHSGGNGQFQNKYALFSFFTGSATDYGWVELSLTAAASPLTEQLTIVSYAYEDSGNRMPAGVPEPGTMSSMALGALALGAVGLRRWRAARKQAE